MQARNISRRNFLEVAAGAGAAAVLAACSQQESEPAKDEEEAEEEPQEAEQEAPAGAKWTQSDSGHGYAIIQNEGGAKITYSPDSGLGIIEDDGFAFKDLEGTGELVPYEDWRLTAEERAEDLASRLTIDQIAGLMCYSGHQFSIEDEVTDEQKEFLDANVRFVLNALTSYPGFKQAEWANRLQAYVEGSDWKLPCNFASDPRNGSNCAPWPDNIALGASFDPELAKAAATDIRREMREMGVTTFLGPQCDVAAEPRWSRFNGTFGEDPALSRDLTRAMVDGLQSTVDENGNDLGWGTESLVSMCKHWTGEGASEGGREAHGPGGKFAVFPGDNFEALMIPFVDGAFKLDGKTGSVAEIMTSYTAAYDADGKYGEPVGSSFSEYKVTDLLRGRFGFDGAACTDWRVINDIENGGEPWGVESLTPSERASKAIAVGVDQIGGCNDPEQLKAAYNDMVAELGEEEADANFRNSARRLLLGFFRTGLLENPYVDVDLARSDIDNDEAHAAAMDAQTKCIVLLKNANGVIHEGAFMDKPKVYVPMRYLPASRSEGRSAWQDNPATCELPLMKGTLDKYFEVVTDTLAETLTGPEDASGNATPAPEDLTRLTAAEIADCAFVLVGVAAPANASSRNAINEDGEIMPLTLQYRTYVADGPNVRQESIGGDTLEDGTKTNNSYYGRAAMITNEAQLDNILEAAALAKEAGIPCIALLDVTAPMCLHEFEAEVDAMVLSLSGATEAACRIISGQDEPSGLLPMQMPLDMNAVEAQLEDVPRDMDCYVDADGSVYDFGFGLNWSGQIDDDRTARYCVAPLTSVEG